MLPRDLLDGLENKEILSRLFDQGDRALNTWEVVCSDFLSPPELAEAHEVLKKLTEIHAVSWGGYPQAERCRLALARVDLPLAPENVELAAIDVAGNFLFDAATHRDFLGACLGSGIERQKVGDIIVIGERGAQIIVVPELVEYLTMNLTQVRTVTVKTQPIELSELKIRPPRTKEMTTVEASLRLDAIASAGFGMSRSKMVDLIAGDEVRVNWKSVKQSSHQLQAGDLVAVRGRGRLSIGDIMITKKNRYRVQLTRYL
ncbi:photosystem II S4 domain protein [Thalassoporum mexicanum PCC 7367]|uniref:photosystem II S4 domain protein n=1 Tax=Thalassoporum mexicanum TaxID=3457544 RepID=UPI00029FC40F|nr:photosystem II S4 domain protein [Pseudanabaena sp. PCC 7367]AFY71663.1 photosystem II S4 domain protein [Pseudanabaena sp. PCC 7367]